MEEDLKDQPQAMDAQRLYYTTSRPHSPHDQLDCITRQEGPLQGEEIQFAYWQQQMQGVTTLLELPTDCPRPAVQNFRAGQYLFVLPPDLLETLCEVSRREEVTLFTTLLAVFKILLHRYSGQEDIVIGTPIAGNREEAGEITGRFVNILALRTKLTAPSTFREVLARVREVTRGVYAHQNLAFDYLVKSLAIPRNLSYTPLFQVMFALQNECEDTDVAEAIRALFTEYQTRVDLSLQVKETAHGLEGRLDYNSHLFTTATIARMVGHWQILLQGVVAQPDQSIATLPLLTAPEKEMVLVLLNDTQQAYPQDRCIHHLFEEQVARTPDATAVVFYEERLTYRVLNEQANQLAHCLRRMGVGPDVLVGVCLERSLKMIVGLLGILKAGGAYVPLDPAYPTERIAFMLEDTQAAVLLTQEHLLPTLPDREAKVICLDRDQSLLAQESSESIPQEVTSRNLAYVIYTSGSTGKPKGVAIEHRSSVALLSWALNTFTPQELAGTLMATSICFDLSIFELFAPLSCGGTVILAENALHLPSLPAANQVTLINTVPSVMTELLRITSLPTSIQTVNLAGEPLPLSLAQALYRLSFIQKVYNLYGPSEDTTYSTVALVERDSQVNPPIGRPITNTQAYILDAHRQLVPIGVPGELYLGGAGLARGYLNRQALTEERFIRNPFRSDPMARLYRTGDRARYLPDGSLEYLGRFDDQVKVRGFRIELGEIEAALNQHPAIEQGVVIVQGATSEAKRLVAYFLAKEGGRLSLSELRAHLKQLLPAYMLPSAFIALETIPLTPSGKIDRKALSELNVEQQNRERIFVAPDTPTEKQLARIWSEVLGVEQVGTEDDFFEWGGHSLLAMQVISRVNKMFGVVLSWSALFVHSTIRQFAAHLEDSKYSNSQNGQDIRHLSLQRPLPLSSAQQSLWFLNNWHTDTPQLYNVPLVCCITGDLDTSALERSLNELIERHEILRTVFLEQDGSPTQIVLPFVPHPLPIVKLVNKSQAEREAEALQLIEAEAQYVFDLRKGPLFRPRLFQLSDEQHLLLLLFHHIITDGWSNKVFLEELSLLYGAFATGQPSPLKDLPFQYADFAVWQQERLTQKHQLQHLAYWKQQLAGELPVLRLPTDHPHPAQLTFQGELYSFSLPSDLLSALKTMSEENGTTLFMTLLSAFLVLLHCYSGQYDIVVGTPVANRIHQASEEMLGCFTNTLALRMRLPHHFRFRELLRLVLQMTVEAFEHQEVPIEQVVKEVAPERSVSHHTLFQVMFALQNALKNVERLGDLMMTSYEADTKTAKYDLSCFVEEDGRTVFEYNTSLWERETISRMASHLLALLRDCIQEPDTLIHLLPSFAGIRDLQPSGSGLYREPGNKPHSSNTTDQHISPHLPSTGTDFSTLFRTRQGPTREKLLAIWCDVLQRKQIKPLSNFFEVGGHSLLATQVVARVRGEFGVDIPLRLFFEHPYIEELAAYIDGHMDTYDEEKIHPAEHQSPLPLSYAQQRMWFLHEIEPDNPFYNVPFGLHLQGAVSTPLAQKTLAEIIQRHAILRTTYRKFDGEVCQLIQERGYFEFSEQVLLSYSQNEQKKQLRELLYQETHRPFDLVQGPIVRAMLVRLGITEYILHLVVHHIAIDMWSLHVFMEEFAAIYQHLATNEPLSLAAPPIQYGDFALWQRQWLEREVMRQQLGYWENRLRGATQVLELPTDHARPPIQTYNGRHYTVPLPPQLVGNLHALGQEESATPFMVLLAAFTIFLYRLTGTEDISIGVPVANRARPEVEGLIGLFLNTLVLRSHVTGTLTYRQLLRQVRQNALDAFEHQNIPFEKLVEELQPHRELSRSPLFQVLLSYQTSSLFPKREVTDIEIEMYDVENRTSKFDLSVFFQEEEETLYSIFEYNTDLFDEETIIRWANHFITLLWGITTHPEQAVSHLPLQTREEKQRLLEEWNRTQKEFADQRCVHERFADIAIQQAQAPAVRHGSHVITYGDLHEKSNQVACHLQSLGVKPDTPVGIYMQRSIPMVIALLAIMRAGGTVVALDPQLPQDRLTFIVEDAGVKHIVVQKDAPCPFLHGQQIQVSEQLEEYTCYGTAQPIKNTTLDDLAYLIYTSGSTGVPKGVAMVHRTLGNLISWQLEHFSTARSANTLQFTPLHFDVAYQEIFATLLAGGQLILIDEEMRRDAVQLLAYLDEQHIERLYLPYVALQQLAEVAEMKGCVPAYLQEVITAGEQLQITPSIQRLFAGLRNATLHNQYGPAETHVVSALTLAGNPEAWPFRPSIGRPIANTSMYILDAYQQPVPIGVVGEIYIGGACLARGYMKREDLTKEKFIPHPFAKEKHERLYRSGDLARYRADGNIEFIGRIDDQVKIRGYRVELGEIESVLLQHPAIKETAVVVRQDQTGSKRLVAYVVLKLDDDGRSAALSEERFARDLVPELRRHLQKWLPEYMIPSAFSVLERMPMTHTGKIDRKALPIPRETRTIRSYLSPQSEIERQIASVWAEVLAVEQVGLEDNFFDLGGHSLLVIRVCDRLEKALGLTVPTMHLFMYSTVSSLAAALQGEETNQKNRLSGERASYRKSAMKKQRERRGDSNHGRTR